ncbi:hypothetical protein BGZ79_006825 [Entomortierella chlamydospora]|nr:hypothetical protein BGZ79_006825 [Entomortierella chlamydospora]
MSAISTQKSTVHGDAQETEQTFQPSDFSFLSQLLHIIQKIESGEEAQEIATLSSNLKTSFKKCQMILDHLPGADLSPDEQERILAEESQVLKRKKAQLATYLSWQVFQHDSNEVSIKQDVSDDTHTLHPPVSLVSAQSSSSMDSGEMRDDIMDGQSEIEIKSEYLESTPSLMTDSSFLLDSSQNIAPSSLSTGLTFSFSDVKMEEDSQDQAM